MAKNRKFAKATQVSLPVPADTASGDPVRVGELNGVALIDRQDDGEATCQLDGAFFFDITGAVGGSEVGDPVTGDDVGITGETTTFGHLLGAVADGATESTPVRIANPVPEAA